MQPLLPLQTESPCSYLCTSYCRLVQGHPTCQDHQVVDRFICSASGGGAARLHGQWATFLSTAVSFDTFVSPTPTQNQGALHCCMMIELPYNTAESCRSPHVVRRPRWSFDECLKKTRRLDKNTCDARKCTSGRFTGYCLEKSKRATASLEGKRDFTVKQDAIQTTKTKAAKRRRWARRAAAARERYHSSSFTSGDQHQTHRVSCSITTSTWQCCKHYT